VERAAKEELMSTREWLKQHGLSRAGLKLDQFIKAHCIPHRTETVAITGGTVSARHCDVFHVSIPTSTFNEVSPRPRVA
jgi:hypothetical protein